MESIKLANEQILSAHGNEIIGCILHTTKSGDVQVLEKISGSTYTNTVTRYKIKFLNTGNCRDARRDLIVKGFVLDKSTFKYVIGETYHTSHSGDIKILRARKGSPENHYSVTYDIEFLNTGNIKENVFERSIDKKSVMDTENTKYHIGDKLHFISTNDDIEIINVYLDNKFSGTKYKTHYYDVKFIDTGYIAKHVSEERVRINIESEVIKATVKDYLKPSICGVACAGKPGAEFDDKELYKNIRIRYLGLINRCYNSSFSSYYRYGQRGITVCERWMNLANFYEDVQKLPGFDRDKVLDSNSGICLVTRGKEYSPEISTWEVCNWDRSWP